MNLPDANRDTWLNLSDEELLSQCQIQVCRGTGPGGQKRNKTSSAVRVLHKPSGLAGENDESRSQHVNKLFALRSLRLQLAIKIRMPSADQPAIGTAPGVNSDKYLPWIAKALDIINDSNYRISDAAAKIGISTGQLVKELSKIPAIWQEVNSKRASLGMNRLK